MSIAAFNAALTILVANAATASAELAVLATKMPTVTELTQLAIAGSGQKHLKDLAGFEIGNINLETLAQMIRDEERDPTSDAAKNRQATEASLRNIERYLQLFDKSFMLDQFRSAIEHAMDAQDKKRESAARTQLPSAGGTPGGVRILFGSSGGKPTIDVMVDTPGKGFVNIKTYDPKDPNLAILLSTGQVKGGG